MTVVITKNSFILKQFTYRIIGILSILAFSLILLLPTIYTSTTRVRAANITLSIEQGPPGISVRVNGDGFTGNIATIKWDGRIIAEKIPISENGEFSYEMTVPRAAKGIYTIEIIDDSHWSGSMASANFKIIPKIEAFPNVGRPSSQISVIGTGFPSGESEITVTWDGTTIKGLTATASLQGTWSITFLVPTTTKGEHLISASGSLTSSTDIGDIVFIVGPAANITPLTGPVGTEITAEGYGFRVGEDGITIDFDGKVMVCNIVGASDGSWETTAVIPHGTKGTHKIIVYGSSFTPKGTIPDFEFEITPYLTLKPAIGTTSNKVEATGTGFYENETVTLTFGNTKLETNIITDNLGSFTATFIVPQLKGKENTVIASGNKGNVAKSIFTSNKPLPNAPRLESPIPNTTIMIFSSFITVIKSTITYAGSLFKRSNKGAYSYPQPNTMFIWLPGNNSEGDRYTLQIASQSDFLNPALIKDNLSNPRYIMKADDILPPGTYYWRVKSTDSVGNESTWSEVWNFEVETMSSSVLILSIAIPALLTAILLAPLLIVWRSRRNTW